MGFADDVGKMVAAANEDFSKIRRKVILELSGRVIKRTPVDKGHHQGAWQTTTGKPATSDIDRKGSDANAELSTVVAGSAVTETVYLSNLGPAITMLEYGGWPKNPKKQTGKTAGGFSIQAPRGMVRVAIAEFPYIVGAATKGTKFDG